MLGNRAILDAIEEGKIVIEPFDPKQLGPNSYDLRLGRWIVRQRSPETIRYVSTIMTDMELRWQTQMQEPLLHIPHRDYPPTLWDAPEYINDGIIRLWPGELILAHTEEIVECHGDIVGEMASRSTLMRNGIAVCVDAGLGDVGYASRWTMEIHNFTQRIIELRVGWRIAQMKFHRVEGVDIDYEQKGGSYGLGEWKPEDMLPRGNME